MSDHPLVRFFVVPELSEPLARAHLAAMKQQMPLLYLIVSINSAVLAVMHYGVAPTALVVVPLVTIVGASVLRSIFWHRLAPEAIARDRQMPMLRSINRITALLCMAILGWAVALEHFSPEVSDMHILTFLSLTSIGCIFCLSNLRSAAMTVAATVIVPTVVLALTSRQADLTAGAINLLLVALVVLRILHIKSRNFVEQVQQHVFLKDLSEENLRLAATDVLTGLPNRRTFFPFLDQMLSSPASHRDALNIALLDLDGFKRVNDKYGHAIGDRILDGVAQRLRGALPSEAVLARIGGDEFAVIARGDAAELGSVLQGTFTQMFEAGGGVARLRASIGVARWNGSWMASEFMECADYAMRTAKAAPERGVVIFEATLEKQLLDRRILEEALRVADLESELRLVFQPLYDADEQRTIGFEALARWRSPILGDVPPDRFVIACEGLGMMSHVTRVLLVKLLGAMREWPPGVIASFNLSICDIMSGSAVTGLLELVAASGIDPARIQFEVTESAMLTDYDRAKSGLERLKASGSMLALDDFGTGFSSLSHVHRLPVDKLKIDKSFTNDILTHETARSIIASTINLSRGLGFDCVVEGVETAEQLAMLRGLGGRVMQGFLFARAMPEDCVLSYLEEERADRQLCSTPRIASR